MPLRPALIIVGLLLAAACGGGSAAVPRSTPVIPTPTNAEAGGFPFDYSLAWETDFTKSSVPSSELLQRVAREGIPALEGAAVPFLATSEVDFLRDQEPVISLEVGDDARAYPLQVLIWHEIVNDVVGGRPVAVTFCPLCNTAIVFDSVVDGRALSFGVSGFLRNSDLVMFDRETESWWQQATGEAIVGDFTGSQLKPLPAVIVSWSDFKEAFPKGRVLSTETGYRRTYGTNPYLGYDDVDSTPFLYFGKSDGRLAAAERVVTVEIGDETVAYPFHLLEGQPVVVDSVGGTEIVVFFKPGTVSALDQNSIADSRDVGAATVFLPAADERRLTFRAVGDAFVDNETGSRWDILGRAIDGALAGSELEPVVSGNHFWFAWAAFKPETRIWQPD